LISTTRSQKAVPRPPPAGKVVGMTAAALASVLAAASCDPSPPGAESGRALHETAATQAALPPSSAEPSTERPIEMFSWWERVGETDALGALFREHRRHFPDDVIINASAGLSGLARKTLRLRMLRNEPPDTFQANAGTDLMQWVLMNGMDARESKVLPLDDVLPDEVAAWRKVMPPVLLDQVSFDGKMYGVPSNVHRINCVFYSKKVFQKFGLSPPKSIDDIKTMGKKLQGTGVALFALGSREPWTVALMVFECLLVAREGPAFYSDYLRGRLKADDPRILRTLEAALDLFRFVNADHAKLSWLQAVELVVREQAAMTVMGDWAQIDFNAHGLRYNQDYFEIPFPATAETFVFTSDAFSLPIEAKNRAGARRLLATIGSAPGQRAMNDAKGALSARTDVPPSDSDPILKEKHALLQRGPLVLALSGIVPAQFAADIGAALAEMLRENDIEPAVHALRSRYALLK
jgi:glucose/mannose transport system substrate-binding protein